MKGFLLGLVVASAGWGGFLLWQRWTALATTESQPRVSEEAGTVPRAVSAASRPRRRPGARKAQTTGAENGIGLQGSAEAGFEDLDNAPEPMKLTPADLRPLARGDDLSRPDVIRVDLRNVGPAHELGEQEIDARFRAIEPEVLDCIGRARPDAFTYIPGRVSVAFRITRDGLVRGVRVEAPAILQRGGLFDCVAVVVRRLRFPASDSAQVVTYPFSLN